VRNRGSGATLFLSRSRPFFNKCEGGIINRNRRSRLVRQRVRAVRPGASQLDSGWRSTSSWAMRWRPLPVGTGPFLRGADARRMEPQGASEMSRLRLHLTKQEAWKAVARLTLAEPAAQRQQSQTRPAFLRAWCKSERLMLLVHRRGRCARERNRA
jgi:hypothetical protein